MRFSLLLPLILLTGSLPCRAGWGGPAATSVPGNTGVVVSAPVAGFSGARTSIPIGVVPVNRGAVVPAATLGANPRGPTVVNGVARYAPITANARPVGTVTATRPLTNPNGLPPAARPTQPVANPVVSPGRLAAFAANADANRKRPVHPGAYPPRHPDRGRPFAAYISYPDNSYYGGRRPGHYVLGETYVQDASTIPYVYPYGASPAYYLGGAYPYFYGGAVGTYGTVPGLTSDATAVPAAPAGDAAPAVAPPPGAPPAAENTRPARSPGLAGVNSLVEAVQSELLRRGYFTGHPDGVFHADTGDALRRFQENHGLASTGLVNEATLFALGLN